MSERAKELLAEAIDEFQSGDGATRLGSYRDAISDILHLAHDDKELRKEEIGDGLVSVWFNKLGRTSDDGWVMFIDEKETEEMAEVEAIPLKKLPIYIGHDWMFNGSIERFEQRLKDKDGTD